MSRALEFHDSTLTAFAYQAGGVRLNIDGYVHHWDLLDQHWKGTGWIQPVLISFAQAPEVHPPELPVEIADGQVLSVGHALVPLPFVSTGSAGLRLHLVTGGTLVLDGFDLSITIVGEGRYLEELPDEFRPQTCS